MHLLQSVLASILALPREMGRIIAVPLVFNLAVEWLSIVQYHTDPDGSSFLMTVITFWVNMAVVPMIAVAWHRTVLLSEPATFLPKMGRKTLLAYFWRWFWLGLGLMIPAGALVWLFYLAYTTFADVDFLYGFAPIISGFDMMIIGMVPVSLYLFLMFRFGVVLPQIALKRPTMRLAEAWKATRPQGGKIAGAAAVTGVVQTALFVVPYVAYAAGTNPETGQVAPSYEYAFGVFLGVSYTLTLLVGAAILTDIYGRINAQD